MRIISKFDIKLSDIYLFFLLPKKFYRTFKIISDYDK